MSGVRKLLQGMARHGAILLFCFAPAQMVMASGPAAAALNIAQLDQLLAKLYGQSDAKTARSLAAVRLTERASAAQMTQWESGLSGDRSRKALMAIVDNSAFLPPPAQEIVSRPQPDVDTARQILARTWNYIEKTLPRFPNFFADRTTTSFAFTTVANLTPFNVLNGEAAEHEKFTHEALGPARLGGSNAPQLYWLGTATQEVTYRGGFEVANSAPPSMARTSPMQIATNGEFGAILGLVLSDIPRDQMKWEHWERGADRGVAVFGYSVPSEKSHFTVTLSNKQFEQPAYHGEIAIDPASGAVLRMTIVATTSGDGFFRESSMLVEFSSNKIGGAAYVCPIHAIAMNRYFDTFEYANTAHTPIPFAISLNDVEFTHYHLFRAESHMLSGAPAQDR